jgi:DNA-binding NarL/FixJ family response regulator
VLAASISHFDLIRESAKGPLSDVFQGQWPSDEAEESVSKFALIHFPGREPMTRREREVLEQFTSGASNKKGGRHLGISPRTIEDHRANIMKKLGARNAADLIRIVMTASHAS